MMKRPVLLFALSLAVFSASAGTPELEGFQSAAQNAGFMCALESNTLRTAIEYGSPKEKEYATSVSDCVSENGKALEEAYRAIPNKSENQDIRNSAKAVYSAWLTYSQALLRGLSYNQTKSGFEAVAFNQALNDYRTELKLAP